MPKTLLAVDDSATMRKVLEITFTGEDFKVLLAESGQAAAKVGESPSAIVVDTVLGNEDGYEVARELRKKNPRAAIVLLASRYNPYDQNRGRDAGADDFADKPFDTQQLIEKVKKAIATRESAPQAAAPAPAPAPAAPAPAAAAPAARPVMPQIPTTAPGVSKATQPSLGGEVRKNATLIFGDQVPNAPGSSAAPVPRAAAPAPAKVEAPAPAPAKVEAPAPAPAKVEAPAPAPQAAVAAAVSDKLAPKLDGLGLTPAQADAVLALSRDVIERVVWEVVPQLAETLIKEEIARLTK